jgi:hypothetical protein
MGDMIIYEDYIAQTKNPKEIYLSGLIGSPNPCWTLRIVCLYLIFAILYSYDYITLSPSLKSPTNENTV